MEVDTSVNLCCTRRKELRVKIGSEENVFAVSTSSQLSSDAIVIIEAVQAELIIWMGTLDTLIGVPMESVLTCPEHGIFATYNLEEVPEYSSETAALFSEDEWFNIVTSMPIITVLGLD